MNESEIINLLQTAAANSELRDQIWQAIVANACGNADQLTLPDKIKLDGILELLHHTFTQVAMHIPEVLVSYAPIFHAVCSSNRSENLLDTEYDWTTTQVTKADKRPARCDGNV